MKAFDEAKRLAEEDKPPYLGGNPEYAKYPDKTVAEVQAIHREQKEIYAAWETRSRKTHRSFMAFLSDQCFTHPDDGAEVKVELSWGHRHGDRLTYHEGEDTDTMPDPAKLAGVASDDDEYEFG